MAPSVAALPAACALEYTSFSRNKPMAAKALIKAPSTTKIIAILVTIVAIMLNHLTFIHKFRKDCRP